MASEKILGAQPRPRLAVITRDPAQPLFDGIADVAPTVDFFTHTSQFSHLEYDIVISNQPNLVGYDQDSEMVNRIKKHQIRTGRIPLMGVRKQFRNTPLGLALACLVIDSPRKVAIARGMKEVEMSWILEDNTAMRGILDSIGSQQYKRYRIYGKTL